MIFIFEIVLLPFLDGDVLRSPSHGVIFRSVFLLQEFVLILVHSLSNRNKLPTVKLLKQGYRYHKLRIFSTFCRRRSELKVIYNAGLKTLLQQGIPELLFYGNTV